MIFNLDPASPKPVYWQIADQVKYALAAERLREGDRLPTIREVAIQTRVNRNTIARAYLELEREGVIQTRPGLGSFIREGAPGPGRARARKELAAMIDETLARARQFRFGREDLQALFAERLDQVNLD